MNCRISVRHSRETGGKQIESGKKKEKRSCRKRLIIRTNVYAFLFRNRRRPATL